MVHKEFRVSGKVQGVFFRKFTNEKAKELGLKGYVQNMKNGDVLVRACGESEKINAMEQWLHVGSPYSRVEKVEAVPLDDQPDYSDFSIKTEGLW